MKKSDERKLHQLVADYLTACRVRKQTLFDICSYLVAKNADLDEAYFTLLAADMSYTQADKVVLTCQLKRKYFLQYLNGEIKFNEAKLKSGLYAVVADPVSKTKARGKSFIKHFSRLKGGQIRQCKILYYTEGTKNYTLTVERTN